MKTAVLLVFLFCSGLVCSQERFFIISETQRKTLDSMLQKVPFLPGESHFKPVRLGDSTKFILSEAIKDSRAFREYCLSGRQKYIFDQVFLSVPLRTLTVNETFKERR